MSQRTDYLRSLINGERERFNRQIADIQNTAKAAFKAAESRLDARDELGQDPDPNNLSAFHSAVSAALGSVGLSVSKGISTVASEMSALPELGQD